MHKRLFDFILASLALTFLLPLFIICVVIIKLTSRGPIFFIQERIGQNGKPFRMIKFRSMVTSVHTAGNHLTTKNDSRITNIGRYLRKHKLDELPQLINVLKGDMSIVGPRPELSRYVNMFKTDFENILTVKPGITDYASIKFKDESELLESPETYEKDYVQNLMPAKIKLYKKYVRNYSWKVDIHILIKTMSSLIRT